MTPDRCGQGSFHSGQCPGPNCRRVEVVGSRVKLVWSGLGAGPRFLCRAVPGVDSSLMDRADFPSSKTARPVVGSRSAYRTVSGK